MFDRCKLSVIHEIYTSPELYQRNPLGHCVFLLTVYPPNSGKTNDTVFNMVQSIKFHVCEQQVGEPYSLGSSNNVLNILYFISFNKAN